ncbi:hypothetical protein JMJ77_0005183 [Colletotrichum scovillei]|uniref:Uncharacterized protein n=1 Tax=Colletotrichum scovillei TaxID=1209932 RepID=A0A9P7RGI8_9PEZI|nr:hypothetical protein JMJ77_0005183 [Colletotrichum scovillei]KAG7076398.1 hypothetical protein JMJ76_0013663 [Colletotrichum scovillei]KAG7083563.1 hypothetical protein JMJ78_0009008 [Colletotrichum scovillei]
MSFAMKAFWADKVSSTIHLAIASQVFQQVLAHSSRVTRLAVGAGLSLQPCRRRPDWSADLANIVARLRRKNPPLRCVIKWQPRAPVVALKVTFGFSATG